MKVGSVERVRLALSAAGHDDSIFEFPEGTRTALDAANAAGCDVSQIVKSLIFKVGEEPVLVLTSGANRVDESKVEKLLGAKLQAAKGRWVRDVTGFAIGGVSPIAHKSSLKIFIDEDLMAGIAGCLGSGGFAKTCIFHNSGKTVGNDRRKSLRCEG